MISEESIHARYFLFDRTLIGHDECNEVIVRECTRIVTVNFQCFQELVDIIVGDLIFDYLKFYHTVKPGSLD